MTLTLTLTLALTLTLTLTLTQTQTLALAASPNPNQDNYPSTSEDIVFLNTPGFVTAIWGLISPMIGQQTQSKIRFASAGAGAVDESQPLIPDAR